MAKLARALTTLLTGLVMIASAIALSGSATAAPARQAATHVASSTARPPCGRRHYPPCPPRKHVYVYPHNVRRGHGVTIVVRHYPAHVRVVVHLAGHHRYIFLGRTRTGAHGNVTFTVRIPRHIPLGKYTLAVLIGSSNHRFAINVIRG